LSRPASREATVKKEFVHFLSVLSGPARARVSLPTTFPSTGLWMLKVLARDGRLVTGIYRRRMEAIRHLGALDKLFGLPATTRNWNTVKAIAKVLDAMRSARPIRSKLD
jgi:hypothetical protein